MDLKSLLLKSTKIEGLHHNEVAKIIDLSAHKGLWHVVASKGKKKSWISRLELFASCFKVFQKLESIEAASVEVKLKLSSLELWLNLFPLALWIRGHVVANKRILVGIVGGPGAGKTVLAQILKITLNTLMQSEEYCTVLGMDGYHYPNAYLGWIYDVV